MKSGIYKIYCSKTNMYYIGQAINVKTRLSTHKNELRKNKHLNKKLQDDFNKYGESAFVFEKIKDVEVQFLNVMESYFMEYYNSLVVGYNIKSENPKIRLEDRKYINLKNVIDKLKTTESIEVDLNKRELVLSLFFYEFSSFRQYYGDEENLINESSLFNNLASGISNNVLMDSYIYAYQNIIKEKLEFIFDPLKIKSIYFNAPFSEFNNINSEEEKILMELFKLVSKSEMYCHIEFYNEEKLLCDEFIKVYIVDSNSILDTKETLLKYQDADSYTYKILKN